MEAEPVDLLIADLKMPKLGGRELIQEIRKREENGERLSIGALEIIIVTAYPMEFEEKQAWRKYDVFEYFIKPVNSEALLRSVDHSLDRKRMREEAILRDGISDEMLKWIMEKTLALRGLSDLRRLSSGFSGAIVARATETTKYGEVTRIVKIDGKKSIDRERDNRLRIEKETSLPSFRYSNIIGTRQLSVAESAIIYEPVNWEESIVPFGRFYRDEESDEICLLLENMLGELIDCWYKHQELDSKPLSESNYHIGEKERREILIIIEELGEFFPWYLGDWGEECIGQLRNFVSREPIGDKNLWERQFDHQECLVHGDLNSNNFFVDADDERLKTWFLIDFAHTEPAHYMMDFAKLEAEVKFFLMDNWIADNLNPKHIRLWIEFEDLLKSVAFGGTPEFPDRRGSSDVRKAYTVISRIRSLAANVKDFNEIDYYIALLYHTLMALRYSQEFRNVVTIKKIFASYCANSLLDELL